MELGKKNTCGAQEIKMNRNLCLDAATYSYKSPWYESLYQHFSI